MPVRMRRSLQFFIVLLCGVVLLTIAGYLVLNQVTRDWFEKDIRLRANLAVAAAQRDLQENWSQDQKRLGEILVDITRDERVMGAAACSMDGHPLAMTDAYPKALSCNSILLAVHRETPAGPSEWTTAADLPEGRVYLSAIVLKREEKPVGVVSLVHDLSFVGRREGTMRNMILVAFFALSLMASMVTFIAARWAWRGWTRDLKLALEGQPSREFQPLVRDVRALVERLALEHGAESRTGPWNPNRLRATLAHHLQGEKVAILANREPYIHEKVEGGFHVKHPASGLVTALEPVMRACGGVWVAHGSGSGDRETVDSHDRVRVPPEEESYSIRRVWLSEAEENGYYYGFSNEGLWPLCHVAHARPVFRTEDWEHYVRVNRKFADAVCNEVDSDEPIVLVQDYHFALAPKMIRDRLPRATILTFWHIPWANAERMGICPYVEDIISGLLGSSIVGFHTQQHCNNFIDSVDAFMESRIDREAQGVVQGARKTLVRPYPISIEWPVHWLSDLPDVAECRTQVRKELGLSEDALLGVGIDRLDYTKGIEERLLAVDELLTRYPEFRGRFTFAQLAAPSRTKIDRYRELNERVEAVAADVNAKWSQGDYRPIVLLRSHHEPPTVFRYYRAAELCYVSSLHDGMNLVAKEFVAARNDEKGVLLLSQFTGAARDLTEALIVNPYDIRQAGDALAAALHMPASEQNDRMQSMRRLVSEFNVYRWAGRMLVDAAELRRKDRLLGRMTNVGWNIRAEVI